MGERGVAFLCHVFACPQVPLCTCPPYAACTTVHVSLPVLCAADGFVTRDEFDKLFHAILPKAQPGSSDRAFAALDLEGNGKVDIVSGLRV